VDCRPTIELMLMIRGWSLRFTRGSAARTRRIAAKSFTSVRAPLPLLHLLGGAQIHAQRAAEVRRQQRTEVAAL
jgi:hypothetical protein